MKIGINKYIGDWSSSDGLCLHIKKVTAMRACVSIYRLDGTPLCRPYLDNKPMIDMQADYNDSFGKFIVHLCKPDSGFSLYLNHGLSTQPQDINEEVLSPALSQYEDDNTFDPYIPLFGALENYKRINPQNKAFQAIGDKSPQPER